ncbi:MAG: S8 family peptidase [Bryobacteraceae bacterium]
MKSSQSWMVRVLGVFALLALFCGSAFAGQGYILKTRGDSLKTVANTYGLTLQRQIFSNQSFSVGVVAAPEHADPNLVAAVAADPNVLRFSADRALPPKSPVVAALSKSVSNLQAWLLSMQDFQQKTNSYLNQPAFKLIGAPDAGQGKGVTVAVIDTALDPTHPLLANKLVAGADCIGAACVPGIPSIFDDATLDQSTVIILEQSTVIILEQSTVIILEQSTVIILESDAATALAGQQLPADTGHGTMVASLIAGAAPGAKIMPIRAFEADGSANLSDIVAGIYYAVDHGAQVINMSFSTEDDPTLAEAVETANQHGVVCVASADNLDSSAAVYPAAYSGPGQRVIGVGSVDSTTGMFKSSFSGYGKPSVDLYAPGENLIAAYPGNHFALASGTSFSTAMVSGAAATLVAQRTGDSVQNYASALINNGPLVEHPADGTHSLNVPAALKNLQ